MLLSLRPLRLTDGRSLGQRFRVPGALRFPQSLLLGTPPSFFGDFDGLGNRAGQLACAQARFPSLRVSGNPTGITDSHMLATRFACSDSRDAIRHCSTSLLALTKPADLRRLRCRRPRSSAVGSRQSRRCRVPGTTSPAPQARGRCTATRTGGPDPSGHFW